MIVARYEVPGHLARKLPGLLRSPTTTQKPLPKAGNYNKTKITAAIGNSTSMTSSKGRKGGRVSSAASRREFAVEASPAHRPI